MVSFNPILRAQEGQGGHNSPGTKPLWEVPNGCGGVEKSQQCHKNFFNAVHSLPKDHRSEPGGTKFASCLRRHLTVCYAPVWGK